MKWVNNYRKILESSVAETMIKREFVTTISSETRLPKIKELIQQGRVKCLPVVDEENKLFGIVTELDYAFAWASHATTLSEYELTYVTHVTTAEKIVNKNPTTILPKASLYEAAALMRKLDIGYLPVIEKEQFVGLITREQLFEIFLGEGG